MLAILSVLFVSAATLTGLWIAISRQLAWFDHPNNRSSHQIPTPTSGGIGFVLTFFLGLLWLLPSSGEGQFYWALITGGGGLAILGLVDDFRNLGIFPRIAIQLLCVLFTVISVDSLPALLLPWFTLESRWVLSAVLVLYGLWQINYFNFMDGIDGLAASESLFILLGLVWFCGHDGELLMATVCLALACSLLGFFMFNVPVARVFMGDTGSNFLGFSLFFLGMLACVRGSLSYWTYGILVSTFLVDSSTTLIGRLLEGRVWYHGHRTHAYQLLAVAVKSHARVVLMYLAVNLIWVAPLAWLSYRYAELAIYIALLAWLPLAGLVWLIRRQLLYGQSGN